MEWGAYAGVIRRRWVVLLVIVALDVAAAGLTYAKSRGSAGFQACTTLYVADVSAPSLISAPPTTLDTAGQLLAGETAANFFGDDIVDVAQSTSVARFVSTRLAPRHLPTSTFADLGGAVSGSRRDRTLSLCVNNGNRATALAGAAAVGTAMSRERARFIGAAMAHRTYVAVVSKASVNPVAASTSRLRLGLEFILGLLLAAGVALLWDAVDPSIRDALDLERALGVPVATHTI